MRGEGGWLLRHLGELSGEVLSCFRAPKGSVTEHDLLVCHGLVLPKLLWWRRKKISAKVEKRRRRAEEEEAA